MDLEKITKEIYEQYCEKAYGQEYRAIGNFLDSLESSGIHEMTGPYVFEILTLMGRQLLEGENVRSVFCHRIEDVLKKVGAGEENLLQPFWTMDEVEKNLAGFVKQSKDLPEPPVWPNALKKEDAWEDLYFSMRYQGEDFLVQFIDIAALVVAHEKLGLKKIPVWNSLWKVLDSWIRSMVWSVLSDREQFSLLSEEIRQTTGKFELAAVDVAHPAIDLLKRLADLDGGSTGKKLFRRIFRHEILPGFAEELKDSGQGKIPISYRLKARLGAMAVESILIEYAKAQAREHKILRQFWKYMGKDTDEGFAFKAGEKTYSIYMCNPDYPFFQIRADENAADTFPQKNPDLGGALFCSWKFYPNGNVLVRFDGFKDRRWLEKEFKKALESSETFLAPLSAESLLKEQNDSRLAFLKEASSFILGNEIGSNLKKWLDAQDLMVTASNIKENIYAAAKSILRPQPGFLQPAAIPQSQEKAGSHVVQKIFTKDTSFLSEKDFQGQVRKRVTKHCNDDAVCIWWFMTKDGQLWDKKPQGPMDLSLDGLRIDNIPPKAKLVLFLIGPENSLNPDDNDKIEVGKDHTPIIYEGVGGEG
jgi:hypothetical protein